MAKIIHGLGQISGKLGNVVHCSGANIPPYVRSIPAKKEDNPTEQQLAVRFRMKHTTRFLSNFRALIQDCWKLYPYKKSYPFGEATGRMITDGFTGEYPDLKIDFSVVPLSAGRLLGAAETYYQRDKQKVSAIWEHYHTYYGQQLDDEVILALYNETSEAGIVVRNAAFREDDILQYQITESFATGLVHAWLIFRSRDGKHASKPHYLGTGV